MTLMHSESESAKAVCAKERSDDASKATTANLFIELPFQVDRNRTVDRRVVIQVFGYCMLTYTLQMHS